MTRRRPPWEVIDLVAVPAAALITAGARVAPWLLWAWMPVVDVVLAMGEPRRDP